MPARDSAFMRQPSEQTSASSAEKRVAKHSDFVKPAAGQQLDPPKKKVEDATTSSVVANGNEWIRDMTDKKPILTVAAALGVGIVLGAFWAR
jgi:ElaB/YqjD/DUF883 family membrane-anchored ribosome-binding protein